MGLISMAWNALGVASDYWMSLGIIIVLNAVASLLCSRKQLLAVAVLASVGFLAFAFGQWCLTDSVITTTHLWGCITWTRTKAPIDFGALAISALTASVLGMVAGGFIRSVAKLAIVIIIIAVAITVLSYLR